MKENLSKLIENYILSEIFDSAKDVRWWVTKSTANEQSACIELPNKNKYAISFIRSSIKGAWLVHLGFVKSKNMKIMRFASASDVKLVLGAALEILKSTIETIGNARCKGLAVKLPANTNKNYLKLFKKIANRYAPQEMIAVDIQNNIVDENEEQWLFVINKKSTFSELFTLKTFAKYNIDLSNKLNPSSLKIPAEAMNEFQPAIRQSPIIPIDPIGTINIVGSNVPKLEEIGVEPSADITRKIITGLPVVRPEDAENAKKRAFEIFVPTISQNSNLPIMKREYSSVSNFFEDLFLEQDTDEKRFAILMSPSIIAWYKDEKHLFNKKNNKFAGTPVEFAYAEFIKSSKMEFFRYIFKHALRIDTEKYPNISVFIKNLKTKTFDEFSDLCWKSLNYESLISQLTSKVTYIEGTFRPSIPDNIFDSGIEIEFQSKQKNIKDFYQELKEILAYKNPIEEKDNTTFINNLGKSGYYESFDEVNKLTKNALLWYTGDAYSNMNAFLRTAFSPDPSDLDRAARVHKEVKTWVVDIIKYWNGLKSLEEDIFVYRSSYYPSASSPWNIDDYLVDPGFMSTSVNNSRLWDSADTGIRILVPKGSKVAVIGARSQFENENEILLPPFSVLKPLKVVHFEDQARQVIECLYVGNGMNDFYDKFVKNVVEKDLTEETKSRIKFKEYIMEQDDRKNKISKLDVPAFDEKSLKLGNKMIKNGEIKIDLNAVKVKTPPKR